MPSWPSTLPDYVLQEGYSETTEPNTLRTEMSQGPAKVRRRFTAFTRNINCQIHLTAAQYEILDGFFHTDLKSGSLTFDWVHPITQASVTFRFKSPPNYSSFGSEFTAGLELEILP
jgi:hypothetical protein